MRYRGFEIISAPDYAITRQNRETGINETCVGYFCEIYAADDEPYAHLSDSLTRNWRRRRKTLGGAEVSALPAS